MKSKLIFKIRIFIMCLGLNSFSDLQELAALLKFVEELERHHARNLHVKKQAKSCNLNKDGRNTL